MNKAELVVAIAEKTSVAKTDVAKCLDAYVEIAENATSAMKVGEKFPLYGIGTFTKTHRAARDGRNVKTGASIKIPAKDALKLKLSSRFKK